MKLKLISITLIIASLSFLLIACGEEASTPVEQSSSESIVSSSESIVSSSESIVSSSESIVSSSESIVPSSEKAVSSSQSIVPSSEKAVSSSQSIVSSSEKAVSSSEKTQQAAISSGIAPSVASSKTEQTPPLTSTNSVPPASSKSELPSVAPTPPVDQVGDLNIATIKQDIIRYTNDLRAKLGLNPLKHNTNLDSVANLRAEEMLNTGVFSHTRPDGRDTWTAFSDLNISYLQAGENLGYAETNGLQDINTGYYWYSMWENSEGHYANLVKPEFTDIGVSLRYKLVGDMYYVYATQIFAKY